MQKSVMIYTWLLDTGNEITGFNVYKQQIQTPVLVEETYLEVTL